MRLAVGRAGAGRAFVVDAACANGLLEGRSRKHACMDTGMHTHMSGAITGSVLGPALAVSSSLGISALTTRQLRMS